MHSSFESHNLIGPDEVLISHRVPGTLHSKPCFQAERGVGSVCARARGGVGSVARCTFEVSRPCSSPSVASRGSDMLSYAESSSRDSGPPQKCFRPSYAHNTQACRYLVGRSAPLSKHSRLLQYTFKMFYHGNDATQGFVCVGLALALH